MPRFALVLSLASILSLSACSSGPNETEPDAGGVDARAEGAADAVADGGSAIEASTAGDALPADGATLEGASESGASGDGGSADADGGPLESPPNGTQLAAGSVVALQGVTSDDYAIYIDGNALTLNAVPLSGGPAIPIGPLDPTSVVSVVGRVAFYWTAVNQSTGAGTLAIWTSSQGTRTLSASSQTANTSFQAVKASPDGSRVVFYDQLNQAGSAGSLAFANADGTGKTTLVSEIDISTTSPCPATFAFAGESVVAVYATVAADDAGPDAVNATAFTGASWAPTSLATNPNCGLAVDTAGQFALVPTGAGLVVFAIPSGTSTLIDATGTQGSFLGPPAGSEAGTPDDILYVDTKAELKRTSVAAPSSQRVLLDAGVNYLWVVSPDTKWALTGQGYGIVSNVYLYDFELASSTTPGELTTLVPTTRGTVVGDPFTTDSSHVLYATAPADGGTETPLTLFAAPTAEAANGGAGDGGVPAARELGVGAWEALAAVGAKVVYCLVAPTGNQVYDVFSVDTSQSAPATALASGADAPFFLSAAKDKLVYTWSRTGNLAGLYVLEIP